MGPVSDTEGNGFGGKRETEWRGQRGGHTREEKRGQAWRTVWKPAETARLMACSDFLIKKIKTILFGVRESLDQMASQYQS